MKTTATYRLLSLLTAAIIVLCLLLCSCNAEAEKITPLDIDNVNGCPEFLDLTWDMTRQSVEGLTDWSLVGDDYLFKDYADMPYGLPTALADLSFSASGSLETVLLLFPASADTTLDTIAQVYYQIYGEDEAVVLEEDNAILWYGDKTIIGITDHGADTGIAVRYDYAPLFADDNKDYQQSAFIDYIDPMAFLSNPMLIGYNINDFIAEENLRENDTYYKEEHLLSGDMEWFSYNTYILYPAMEFFGTPYGSNWVEINASYDSDIITSFSYYFLYPNEDLQILVALLQEQLPNFELEFGPYQDGILTPINLDGPATHGLSLEECLNDIANQQDGTYTMQWHTDQLIVSLFVFVDSSKDDILSYVQFSTNQFAD